MTRAARPPEITGHDLYAAYLRARLRKLGISYQTALTTECTQRALLLSATDHRKRQPALSTGKETA